MRRLLLLFGIAILFSILYPQKAEAACSDGFVNSLEGCVECTHDGHCQAQGKVCSNYKCIECRTTEDCPTNLIEWTSERTCDSNTVREIGYKKIPLTCTSSKTCAYTRGINTSKFVKDCTTSGNICVQGSCGCPSGELLCSNTCVKEKAIAAGESCNCDGQCEQGVCYNKTCLTPLNVSFPEENSSEFSNKTFNKTLFLENLLNTMITANLNITTSAGNLQNSECELHYCYYNATLEPVSNKTYIVSIVNDKKETISITARATVYDGTKTYSFSDEQNITFESCGDGVCSAIETSENCCSDCACQNGYTCNETTQNPQSIDSKVCQYVCGDALVVEGEDAQTCCIDAGCGDEDGFAYKQCQTTINTCMQVYNFKLLLPFLLAPSSIILTFILRRKIKKALRLLRKILFNLNPKHLSEEKKQKDAEFQEAEINRMSNIIEKWGKNYSKGTLWFEPVRTRKRGGK